MASHDLKELEQNDRLQWSYYELQTRVAKMGEINSAWASRTGKRGKWLVSDAGLEVLVQLRELEQNGSSVDAALKILGEETTKPPVESSGELDQQHLARLHAESRDILLDRITALQAQVQDLQSERDRLLSLLENMTLALPPARQTEVEHRGFRWPWKR
jgi:uncharacterized protein YlxW (UPF0749 family)